MSAYASPPLPASSSEPGYDTKQETIALLGLPDIQIRSLLDKQQFHDPLEAALRLGISSAAWPLFGLLWPSGRRLAERLGQRPVATGERILEIGCGLALSSLVGHRRGADMTASDCHPLAAAFLRENLRLNALLPMKYCHGQWGGPALSADTDIAPGPDRLLHGRYDLIIGSDILYERDEAGTLAAFIDAYAAPACEVWVVDPNRGNRAHFHRHMAAQAFGMHEGFLDSLCTPLEAAYKGRMLTYVRT